MGEKFGNVTLGEINETLISFIGKDMYIEYWKNDNPKESVNAYDKHIRRLFHEEDSDFTALCLKDKNSIARYVFERILPDLHENYGLSDELCKFMREFVDKLYRQFTNNETPILETCTNYDSVYDESFSLRAKQKYKSAIENITKEKSISSRFNDETLKNVVYGVKNSGNNPTWASLKKLLDIFKNDNTETISLLIDAYVMTNIANSFSNRANKKAIVDVQYVATNLINVGIQFFFVDHNYKNDERRAEEILKSIEQYAPEASKFFCNWFRGYHCIAKGELKTAKDYYKKAFEARRFAGCQFEKFIKQAVALSCYLDFNADKVRDSADVESVQKSPLPADAKRFWSYGYAAGVFDQKAEETHQMLFHRHQNFYRAFSKVIEHSDFKEQFWKDYAKLENITERHDEQAYSNQYEKLKLLSNETINQRLRFMDNHQTKNPPITLALFCYNNCCIDGYSELAQKFLELIKYWLKEFPNLDLSIYSDKHSSIACDAIQQYKLLKLNQHNLQAAELKPIVMQIIAKSSVAALTITSLKCKRSALMEAIESCDVEIAKAVADKIPCIDNLRLSADESSPVYYAINRYIDLYRYKNDITLRPAEIAESSMLYQNLDAPGFSKEEKICFMNSFPDDIYEVADKVNMWQMYGEPKLWDKELNEISDVCLCLIERTKNQDDYKKQDKDLIFTSLLYAAESDNVEICRSLLQHGAKPNINPPYTFLHRIIYWKSWNVLEMYLSEFPKCAKEGINDIDKLFRTPLVRFLEEMEKQKSRDTDYVKRIFLLFKNCGAQFNPQVYMLLTKMGIHI